MVLWVVVGWGVGRYVLSMLWVGEGGVGGEVKGGKGVIVKRIEWENLGGGDVVVLRDRVV